ncbi:MAG: hypothetical protein L3K09_01145 [Thermoplasmata archaeon]|nr:hypothetical protein [Thermoplasmata archaeon]
MPARRRSREELSGLLEGVRHRLAEFERRSGTASADRKVLGEARRSIEHGRLEEAEAALIALDRRIPREEEVELMQKPRGLVGYVPRGSKGAPPAREEEPLSNRMTLLQRIYALQQSRGHDVEPLLPDLHAAERAYARGEWGLVKQICDRVLGALEELEPPKAPEEHAEGRTRPRRAARQV